MIRKKAALALQASNSYSDNATTSLLHGEHTYVNQLQSSLPSTAVSTGSHSDQGLLHTLQQLRVEVTKWAKNWGPEGSWDSIAEEWVSDIQKLHQQSEANELLNDLFMDWDNHARKGRDLLQRLQALTDDLNPITLASLTEL